MSKRYDEVNRQWDDRAYKAYGDFTAEPKRYLFFGSLVVVAVLILLVLGGWQIGWWFKNQNINRESHALRNSYAAQQTLRDQLTQNIGAVLSISTQISETTDPSTQAALKAQRIAVVNIVCGEAAQVTGDPLDSQQAQFISTNCEAGTIKPSSPYN